MTVSSGLTGCAGSFFSFTFIFLLQHPGKFKLVWVKGPEREVPDLQAGDESGAAIHAILSPGIKMRFSMMRNFSRLN